MKIFKILISILCWSQIGAAWLTILTVFIDSSYAINIFKNEGLDWTVTDILLFTIIYASIFRTLNIWIDEKYE